MFLVSIPESTPHDIVESQISLSRKTNAICDGYCRLGRHQLQYSHLAILKKKRERVGQTVRARNYSCCQKIIVYRYKACNGELSNFAGDSFLDIVLVVIARVETLMVLNSAAQQQKRAQSGGLNGGG